MAQRAPQPKPADGSLGESKGISSFLKSTGILNPATTSHFLLYLYPHEPLRNFLNQKAGAGAAKLYDQEKLSLSCCEAALPGSSIATHEINNNYTGVTERHAYRRLYDERASFTFYVDHDYASLTFFETWMQYVAGEQFTQGLDRSDYFYRFNYPGTRGEGYRIPEMSLSKFEKDYSGSYLQYTFLDAFPIGLNSIPVSYENSQLLKCTVSFAFTRYVVKYESFRNLESTKPVPNGTPPAARRSLNDPSELERLRGAAALGSIGSSPNADRILSGNARSAAARGITNESYNRVLYGNPNGGAEP